jgi:hypothetical protein
MFIFFIIAAVGPWSYWAWVTYLNKQKAKHIAANAEANITAQDEEFLDLTDREQLRFVYCK